MTEERRIGSELTDKQRECLRLVALNYNSKEIARKLGVSPFAVDQRLRIAVRNLDVSNRFEAARLLSTIESDTATLSDPLIYQASHVPLSTENDSPVSSEAYRDRGLGVQSNALHDAGAMTWPSQEPASPWTFNSISESGGFQGSLSWQTKAILAVAIAVISLIAFSAAVAGLEVLSRIN